MSTKFKMEHRVSNYLIETSKTRKDMATIDAIIDMIKKIPLEKLKVLFNIEWLETYSVEKQVEFHDKVNKMDISDEYRSALKERYENLLHNKQSMIVGSINI